MSRFKELNRIENAIKHQNKEELQWAHGYAKIRLASSSMKEHEKHWREILSKVERAMEQGKG